MLIQSLRLENFRQFKGATTIEFSCEPERNVTIILGDNTFGKTTLLQAFNWCLYGKAVFDEPNFLLNKDIAFDMINGEVQTVRVEINLINEKTEYIISRSQRYTCINGQVKPEIVPKAKVSYKEPDGQMQAVKALEVDGIINKILPSDLSTYFFFDTERVNSISTRRDVAEAVKGLLGLAAIDSAIKHLGDRSKKSAVIGKFYADMDIAGDARANEIKNQLATAEDKRSNIAEQLDNCKQEISDYETEIEQLHRNLQDNHETSELQKRRAALERQIKTEKHTVTEYINKYFQEFSEGALPFFSQALIEEAAAVLKDVKLDERGISDVTRASIMEILERGKCICGREICEGSEAYEYLKAEIAYVPPESIGNVVRNYRRMLERFSRSAPKIFERLDERCTAIFSAKSRIGDYEYELENISERLEGKANVQHLEKKLLDCKKRLKELTDRKDRLNREDGFLERTIESCRKTLDSLAVKSGKNKQLKTYIAYAEAIRDWLEKSYKDQEIEIRAELESEVNKIFEKMYHGNRRISLDARYRVTLLTRMGNDEEIFTGESEGLNRVKNFAFIAGLVSLAKKRIMRSDKNDLRLTSEPYPLVMDAPFSNADEIHTANISKILPEVAEQVIMFVMQKDWNYAEQVMSARVGKKYQLNKISETCTKPV